MMSVLEDKDAIRDLMTRYCLSIDAGRYADWVACFSEDGCFDSPILGTWRGPEKLLAFTSKYQEWTGDSPAAPLRDEHPHRRRWRHRERGELPSADPRRARKDRVGDFGTVRGPAPENRGRMAIHGTQGLAGWVARGLMRGGRFAEHTEDRIIGPLSRRAEAR